uniref:Major facilitator superfamily associated domain-containing protein n=1 Tax=Odontella aurita TaxID=265563 RepID=A0A7S4JMA4_9STRA|mmetsp:Transcript_49314/g.148470  ORF Transcript_49314/g.148470 Transcript_49314/m.148470 type:complete len:527 (+) Transcript_49314:195-1775(+)
MSSDPGSHDGAVTEIEQDQILRGNDESLLEPLLRPEEASGDGGEFRSGHLSQETGEGADRAAEEEGDGTGSPRLVDGMDPGTSLLLKSLYFLEALAGSAWGRFGTVYYNVHGLTPQQIGLMLGLMPAVRAFSQPLWGYAADRWRCRKAVYLITKCGSTVVVLMLALPAVYHSWIRMLLVTLSSAVFSSSGVLDAYTLDLLGKENRIRYGRYRLWSSVSWGLGAVAMGSVTDRWGFEPNFAAFGVLSIVNVALVAWKIPDINMKAEDDRGEEGDEEGDGGDIPVANEAHISDLFRLALRPRVAAFMIQVIVIGGGMATVERLLFLYLVNDLGSSTLLCGLSVLSNVIFELPIFWYAQHFMHILGRDGMFAVSMLCFVVRVYGYTLLTPSVRWLILPLEALHGVTFACFWVTLTDVTKSLIIEAKGWSTTIPTGVQMLYNAVGVCLGSVLGGWAMKEYGSREMYRAVALIVCINLGLHVVGLITSRLLFRRGFLPEDSKETPDNDATDSFADSMLQEPDNDALGQDSP